MGRHKKGWVPPVKQELKTIEAEKKEREPLLSPSNWGANESRRKCPHCGSIRSYIKGAIKYQGPLRLVRHRQCMECGQRYTTCEAL